MSIDFTTLQALEIPEGGVTQIEDASGSVLWMANGGKVILEVEKITSNTYAGETTYENEEFILFDIYPKTNRTVSVTYGGLTKTITDTSGAEEPNAQQVFFGTFNGVSDGVATPASGTLTIEGDCSAFACSAYDKSSKDIIKPRCGCVTAVKHWGGAPYIADNAFYNCDGLTSITIPSSVASIGAGAFNTCDGLTSITIPKNVKTIGDTAFYFCRSLASVTLSEGVESIGTYAFKDTALTSFHIPSSVNYIHNHPCQESADKDNIITVDSKNTSYKIDGNCLIEIATGYLLAGFRNSVIPSYVTRIGRETANGSTFGGQTSLKSVTIPAGVELITSGAFYGCTGLTEIIVLATTPPTLGNAASVGGTDLTCPIIVPKGCGDAYKAAEYWSDVADRIVEAE